MARLGEIALDCRRVQGDAALAENRTREQIEAEIQQILDEAAEIDVREDEEHEPENCGEELPEELRGQESRLELLREAKATLDQEDSH